MKTAIRYPYSRLAFRRKIIEKLAASDSFEVETPEGTYRFTREEFEKVFSNVIKTKSYLEYGLYHYPRTPEKASPYGI
jgi:hypothetical protein